MFPLEPSVPLIGLASIFVGSVGIPVPTLAVLIYTGSLLAVMPRRVEITIFMILSGVTCALLMDIIWFAVGRRIGSKILRLLCRLAISHDTCVRNTAELFARQGVKILLFSRFLPGLPMVTSPLAGASGVSVPRFVLFDATGIAVWIAVGLGAGAAFSHQIATVLFLLGQFGIDLGGVAVAVTLIFIGYRWGRRRLLIRQLRMARISVDALNDLIGAGTAPTVLDVRSELQREADPFLIPGAVVLKKADPNDTLSSLPRGHPVIVYCACPNEASAALMARQLQKLGFTDIRPLLGGIDAWRAAGLPVEPAYRRALAASTSA
jgi:membrane protein DedA with SNARE-associated domain/rhodanese-related sulfurtransferase